MNTFGMGTGMWLFWIILLLAVAVIVRVMMNKSANGSSESSLQILEKRYARGEINSEEFKKMKQQLEDKKM